MTLQQTISITKERRVQGEAEVKKKNTQSLCGMFADTGDTLDKFLARKRANKF
jgi:hypothetical protein